jgi:hypothetical protein
MGKLHVAGRGHMGRRGVQGHNERRGVMVGRGGRMHNAEGKGTLEG